MILLLEERRLVGKMFVVWSFLLMIADGTNEVLRFWESSYALTSNSSNFHF